MDYFAGLDISMDETHVCVLDREGVVVRESKTASTAQAIAGELAKAPSCHRIVFETGRMAPILFHELNQLGLPATAIPSSAARISTSGSWTIWPTNSARRTASTCVRIALRCSGSRTPPRKPKSNSRAPLRPRSICPSSPRIRTGRSILPIKLARAKPGIPGR
jgi:hypothetical protein